MRSLLLAINVASTVIVLASSASAQSQPGFEEALHKSNYPIGSNETLCYAKTDTPNTFDLSRLCGFVSAPMPVSNVSTSYNRLSGDSSHGGTGYTKFSTGGTSSGVCNFPSDIARDGSRCGGRAASERPGGR
ncbi:MAG: hypothetical protein V7K76_14410 [Nostoc sp.]|uniref:hypothetical protein n=1 Tax=Nostoc sp. TaxID=1180 RepID=UPI002FF7B164